MKSRIKTAIAVTTLALTASTSINADACDRGGRGNPFARGPYGITIPQLKRYSKPVYRQPVYSQPAVCQQPVQTLPPTQIVQQPQFATQPPIASSTGQVPTNSVNVNVRPVNTAPTQPSVAPPTSTPQRSVPQPSSANSVVNRQAPATNNRPANTEASALQMLASITTSSAPSGQTTDASSTPQIPQFAPASNDAAAEHVGTWSVSLPGNQSVELVLNGDGSFTWTATKNGNSNNFQGQYRLENNRLTLVRSNDLQQMAGSWVGGGEGFVFKLDGATTGGLSFKKS